MASIYHPQGVLGSASSRPGAVCDVRTLLLFRRLQEGRNRASPQGVRRRPASPPNRAADPPPDAELRCRCARGVALASALFPSLYPPIPPRPPASHPHQRPNPTRRPRSSASPLPQRKRLRVLTLGQRGAVGPCCNHGRRALQPSQGRRASVSIPARRSLPTGQNGAVPWQIEDGVVHSKACVAHPLLDFIEAITAALA